MKSIHNIVTEHVTDTPENVQALETALLEREDNMADILRLAGAQFGLYPWIVAEVLAAAGLGTPPTPEQRAFIHNQFVEGMEQLRRAHEEGTD